MFSEYALRSPDEALRKLQDAFAVSRGKSSWTDLTQEEQEAFWRLRPDLR